MRRGSHLAVRRRGKPTDLRRGMGAELCPEFTDRPAGVLLDIDRAGDAEAHPGARIRERPPQRPDREVVGAATAEELGQGRRGGRAHFGLIVLERPIRSGASAGSPRVVTAWATQRR